MDESRLNKAHDMIFGGNIFDKRAQIRRSTKEQAAEDNPMLGTRLEVMRMRRVRSSLNRRASAPWQASD